MYASRAYVGVPDSNPKMNAWIPVIKPKTAYRPKSNPQKFYVTIAKYDIIGK